MSSQKKAKTKALPVESSSETDTSDNESSSSSNDGSQEEPSQVSHTSEHKDLQPAITLSCLRSWNAPKMNQCLQNYVSKLRMRKTTIPKIGVKKLSKIQDFTPWWDEFSKPVSKSSAKSQVVSVKGNDSFDNWFDKSHQGTSFTSGSSSWLSGHGYSNSSEGEQHQNSAPVEDIEVPSIYNQAPKTKGRRALKRERKAEREKTLGKKWFEMRAPEVDSATRMDMEMIRMRGVLDPKRFYKSNDRGGLPKYFQMGTVVDEGTDFYSSRLTKKQRKQTLVEELMADANVRQYNKRKYSEVQQKMRNKKFKGKKTAAS
ncbi:deoxynucleotidyltransferase terminal-interacting protein 2 [Plakobranchus ocellatus]|uniref:Deoxynucleotidyltransferase terminal-interacting protein 2 n=1 Tax=Plakobranchus ocellatus TaxID=259542 RepID=A0AAV3ZV09_9GAST|nr:deoxynucleotidyltransferase terminal-interacting protein 2 [Plakobranchus ocellatus]